MSSSTCVHLDELAQMREARLLGGWDLADQDEDRVHDCLLVLEAAVLQHPQLVLSTQI